MRTVTGRIYYSVSDDARHNWRSPEELRYASGSATKCSIRSRRGPLYALADGRYVLFYHNHDGTGYGGRGPWDNDSRRLLFLAVALYDADARQPLRFGDPQLVCDTHGVGVGPESRSGWRRTPA